MIRRVTNLSSPLSHALGRRHRNLIPFAVSFAQYGTQFLRDLSCAARETPEDEDVPHDHFDTLGIDRSFVISPQELKSKYKHLMKELHPDKHSSIHEPSCSSRTLEEEKALKASMATDVTRAYGVIVNPLSRALHLLELWGAPIGEGDSAILGNNLLMEIMEVREDIENASTDEELRPLLESCRSKQNDLCDQLAKAFREERVDDARFLTAQLQYWNRIEETVLDKISHIH